MEVGKPDNDQISLSGRGLDSDYVQLNAAEADVNARHWQASIITATVIGVGTIARAVGRPCDRSACSHSSAYHASRQSRGSRPVTVIMTQ